MASRPSHRGRGSNQYADRTPSGAPAAGSLSDTGSRLIGAAPVPVGTAVAGDHLTARPTGTLVKDMHRGLAGLLSRNVENSPEAVTEAVTEVSVMHDAILTKHPDAYGIAVSDGVYWGTKVGFVGTRERTAVDSGDPTAVALNRDYRAVLGDASGAPEQALDVDQLASTLERIAGNEAKWNGMSGEGSASGESQPSNLACRHAALSVVCSRSSQDSVDLRTEKARVGEELNKRMMERVGL